MDKNTQQVSYEQQFGRVKRLNAAQNTQQPVAWVNCDELDNMLDDRTATVAGVCDGWRSTPLYTAQPVPRDVLMAALGEINTKLMEVSGTCFSDEYIAALADRYASQVQPEPVNQQTLAALKACDEAMSYISEYDIPITLPDMVRSAIAAAEAAQPVACDEMSHEWTATRKGIFDKLAELGAIQTYSCCNVINKRCGTDKFEMKASQIEQLVFEVEKSTKLARIFQEGWRTYAPNVSSEHIKAIAKACKLIPSHTTKELVDRVVGFGHVLLGDKAVQEKFVEANAHLLCASQQPASAQPVARIKTVGGYPDDSRHELELLVKHGQLSDGQLLYAHQPAVAVPDEWINTVNAAAIALESARAMLSAAKKPEGGE